MNYRILICLLCGLLVSCELIKEKNYETYVLPNLDKALCEEAKNMVLELNSVVIEDGNLYEETLSKEVYWYYTFFTEDVYDGTPPKFFWYYLEYNNQLENENHFDLSFSYRLGPSAENGFEGARGVFVEVDYTISKDYHYYRQYDSFYSGSNSHKYPDGTPVLFPGNVKVSFGYFYDRLNKAVKVVALLTGVNSDINVKIKIHTEEKLYISNSVNQLDDLK